MTGRFAYHFWVCLFWSYTVEPMLVEVVEVAVRPASVYQRGNGIDDAFDSNSSPRDAKDAMFSFYI